MNYMNYKKLLCALVLSILGYYPIKVWAQKEFYAGLRALPQASFLISSADKDSGLTRTLSLGYAGGIAVGQNFSKHVGFEFSALYSKQGQNYDRKAPKGGADTTTLKEKTELTYLKIPMLLRYFTPLPFAGRRLHFAAHFGPQVGILLDMKQYQEGAALPENVPYSRYIKRKDFFNPTEIHLAGGLGLEYTPTPQFLITILTRADYSLIDALDKTLKTPGQPNANNLTLGIMLGFSYSINK
jgi:hypothetical protein